MTTLIQAGTRQKYFGRMDDVQTFKNTKRIINLSWTIPSHSEDEAISNFIEVSKLMSFTYPAYEPIRTEVKNVNDDKEVNNDSAVTLPASAVANLLQAINNTENEEDRQSIIQFAIGEIENDILSSAKENGSPNNIVKGELGLISSPPILILRFVNWINGFGNKGLYGRVGGFSFSPDMENGTVFLKDGVLVPMFVKCSCEFTVIHSDLLRIFWERKTYKGISLW